jgi:hypothetical protein
MRELLAGVNVRIDDVSVGASTTIAAVGGNVLVLVTALPARALTLTSCFLARSDAALAVSRLASDAHEERLTQRVLAATEHHATLAGACLLDHAAALRELLAVRAGAPVSVDVDPNALDCAADAWGPPAPPG